MTEDQPQPIPLPRMEADAPPRRRRRTRLNAVTSEQRDAPYTRDPHLLELERAAAEAAPDQLPLFLPGPQGSFAPALGGMPPLEATSSLELARSWYRRTLEQARRPANTIESYCYDLDKLEQTIGHQQINKITRAHIANFLGLADARSTRKRRLTSLRRFFLYLIDDAKVLEKDPTDGFYPHTIGLKLPVPLFPEEQEAVLAAAAGDEPWSQAAIWLMMRLGLTRGELLALRRDHIELTDPARPVVYVFYEELAKRGKERKLAADAAFGELYTEFLRRKEPADLLFPVGFQAVNGMVERVRKAAEITKEVTPAVLRHTFAVERAKDGADEQQLLELLGLADDPRNRMSVQRYLKLASPGL